MDEQVSVSIAGAPFGRWRKVVVHAGVKHAARTAEVTFQDIFGAPVWPSLFAGQPAFTVSSGDGPIFTGFVDAAHPKIGAKVFDVTIAGKAKGADAVESSVDHTKPDYVNSNVLAVAQSQDQFGIGFSIDFSPDGFDLWRPNVGESLFHSLAPLAEEEGATLAGLADGSIKITRAGATAPAQGGALEEGVNIWEMSGQFDVSAQHSKITEHGQSFKGNGPQNIAISASAANSAVSRTRPLHHHHDRHTSRDRLKRRASRRRDKEQGEGIRATAKLRGWRDDSDMLWAPGNKVYVKSPSLGLTQYMLIETVIYEQDAKAGTTCQLHLVDPRAHGGMGGGVNKSGSVWKFDDSAAT